MLIEKPTGFFEADYLKRLRELFDPNYTDRKLWNYFQKNNPTSMVGSTTTANTRFQHITFEHTLVDLVSELTRIGVDPRKIKTLEMGSGNGYVLAAFALHNCPIYGIELTPELIEDAKKRFQVLPIHRDPEIKQGSYYDAAMRSIPFEDGTRFSDIDIFYCNAYSYDGFDMIKRMLTEVLAVPNGARVGALVYIPAWWNPKDPVLQTIGFEAVLPSNDHLATHLLKKVKFVDLEQRVKVA